MGNAATMKARRSSDSGIHVEEANPFEEFNKKERFLLYETWEDMVDSKKLLGTALQEFLETRPGIRAQFGVDLVPRARYLEKPKAGAHLNAVLEFIGRLVQMLGYHENTGASLAMVKSVGRVHAHKAPQLCDATHLALFDDFVRVHLAVLVPKLLAKERMQNPTSQMAIGRVEYEYSDALVEETWEKFLLLIARVIKFPRPPLPVPHPGLLRSAAGGQAIANRKTNAAAIMDQRSNSQAKINVEGLKRMGSTSLLESPVQTHRRVSVTTLANKTWPQLT